MASRSKERSPFDQKTANAWNTRASRCNSLALSVLKGSVHALSGKVLTIAAEMFFDRGNHYEFLSLGQELAAPGDLQHPQTFDFNFKNVEKQYESYNGINVKLRYFVRVTVSRRMADVIREKDIWVYSYRIPPETNSSIKMDVGIEDCLHIEFEYSKSKYHLKDVIVGRIYFLLVRLKIKHMELSIIRRETTGVAPNQYNESETLVRFEVSLMRVRLEGQR